ncbi:MAG: flagellar cap protein FliD N-terminal domain-containing protein, partial [Clostridium sp.]|nr:flagellar cap protein FliD N-terminal domain-containing protein [Clostridium sp.]
MTNRITGTNSGIDVDAVVKASLTTEQNKIDKAYQQQKVYEYQQEQLRKIVDQCTDFYDKYLDILSSDSLMKSSAYESVSFTGDNNNVTAKGYAGADIGEYKVNVTQLASKAKGVITSTLKEGDKISVK